MKIEYDREADALYICIKEEVAEKTEDIAPGVAADFDKDGNLIGVEVLYATKKYSKQDIFDVSVKNLVLAEKE